MHILLLNEVRVEIVQLGVFHVIVKHNPENPLDLYLQDIFVEKRFRGNYFARKRICDVLLMFPNVQMLWLVAASGSTKYWRNQGFVRRKDGKMYCEKQKYLDHVSSSILAT